MHASSFSYEGGTFVPDKLLQGNFRAQFAALGGFAKNEVPNSGAPQIIGGMGDGNIPPTPKRAVRQPLADITN